MFLHTTLSRGAPASGVGMRTRENLRRTPTNASAGFSMIELLIAMAIIGILAAVAYPSYKSHIAKANRAAAEGFLTTVANKQEQYMLDRRQYATGASALTDLGISTPTEVSRNYTITVLADNTTTPPSYTLTASPTGAQQQNDSQCGAVTLTQAGAKGPSAACW